MEPRGRQAEPEVGQRKADLTQMVIYMLREQINSSARPMLAVMIALRCERGAVSAVCEHLAECAYVCVCEFCICSSACGQSQDSEKARKLKVVCLEPGCQRHLLRELRCWLQLEEDQEGHCVAPERLVAKCVCPYRTIQQEAGTCQPKL